MMKTQATADPITQTFARFAGRNPQEGDFYQEAPEKILDQDTGDLVSVTRCWEFTDGRWEGFVTVARGATWAH